MNFVLTMDGMVLYKEDIERLEKTDEGRRLLKRHMFSSKTAFTANQLLNYLENEANILNRKFTYEEQQTIASLIHWGIFDSKWPIIEEYIRGIIKAMENGEIDEFLTCDAKVGNC